MASSAPAAVRYAGPGGSGGEPCADAAAPCPLGLALSGATDLDVVQLAPGDYGSAADPLSAPLVTTAYRVAASAYNARPRIFVDGEGPGLDVFYGTVSWVEVRTTSASPAVVASTAEQVVVRNTAEDAVACDVRHLHDSFCVATGAGGVAAAVDVIEYGQSRSATLTNVTAVASADGGTGVRAFAGEERATAAATLTNVIAAGDGIDLLAMTDGWDHSTATIAVAHSNYDTSRALTSEYPSYEIAAITPGEGNQTAAPRFVGLDAGDVHQAAGSPTIDAGVLPTDSRDVDQFQRVIGAAPDIGGDEFAPPPTLPQIAVLYTGRDSATIGVTVNPNGRSGTLRAEWGTTQAYGQTTLDASFQDATTAYPRTLHITGLQPARTYHARIVATTAAGSAASSDLVFTTLAPYPQSTPAVVPPRLLGVSLTRTRFALGKRPPAAIARFKAPVGTVIKVRATGVQPGATATFTLHRVVAGRRSGNRCVAAGKAKVPRSKRCEILTAAGSFTVSVRDGTTRVRFEGRTTVRRALKPGRYQIQVRIHNPRAGGSPPMASNTIRTRFTLLATGARI